MGKKTAIDWTDHTYNPWWGCEKISPGCSRCYAATFAKRTGHDVWGPGSDRRHFADAHWLEPVKWNEQARSEEDRPRLVFCASMADVFENRPDLEDDRARLFDLIEKTPYLRWLLLTKRPENVLPMVPPLWLTENDVRVWQEPEPIRTVVGWPANAWIGTTVEDQARAEERIPTLLEIPAPVRFLSCEPLLERVHLGPWLERTGPRSWSTPIDWIIAGGESGPKFRPLDLDHARHLEAFAAMAGVPFFYKQRGGLTPKAGGRLLDGSLRWAWPKDAGDRSDVIRAAMAEEGLVDVETPVEIS